MQAQDLTSLEEQFTEEEVLAVVQDIATDKAPGPDGYIGAFFKASWRQSSWIFWQLLTISTARIPSISNNSILHT